ncbi:MAG: AAA family ATPase, partial [Geminicoccaceae bacterium]|nr:AAA family ATPase [Geminicoccaceae bacterium]
MIPPRANPDLFGQERAWRVLERARHLERIPHAWLVAGPRGVGKATLAHRFARALLAGPSGVAAATGQPDDPAFRQCAADAHPDLVVLEPPAPGKGGRQRSEIGVDQVRDATRSLHRTVAGGACRVLLVDGAEALNRNAVNALLKPLEEPPPATVILLVSHDPFRLLPTVRSRCTVLRAARLEVPVIERILAAQAGDLEAPLRAQAARLCNGSAGRAFELAQGGLEAYRSLTLTLGTASRNARGLHDLAETLRRRADVA